MLQQMMLIQLRMLLKQKHLLHLSMQMLQL